jgi:hypothetical protein
MGRTSPVFAQLYCHIPRACADIEDSAAVKLSGLLCHPFTPSDIKSQTKEMIQEVIAGSDVRKHPLYFFGVTFFMIDVVHNY